MLIRLLPEQVEERWDYLAPAIAKALPPTVNASYAGMVNVLRSLLLESAYVWELTWGPSEDLHAVIVTSIFHDAVTGVNHLLVYSVTAVRPLNQEMWEVGVETLKKFARSEGFQRILAYTSIKGIARLVEDRLGGYADFTLIEIPVE